MLRAFFLSLCLSLWLAPAARAEEAVYSLTNLEPAGVSLYRNVGHYIDHEFFTFRNALGTHHLIYEDKNAAPPLKAMDTIREAAKGKALCQLDLACRTKAFCTGSCKNFYYEVSNQDDPSRPNFNQCTVRAFTCQAAAAQAAAAPTGGK